MTRGFFALLRRFLRDERGSVPAPRAPSPEPPSTPQFLYRTPRVAAAFRRLGEEAR